MDTDENIVLPPLKDMENFAQFMARYKAATRVLCSKLEVLNDEFSVKEGRNPIESITSRVKSPQSIAQKLRLRGYEMNEESILCNLSDVAGVRVICSFIDDIYSIAEMLSRQDDIKVIEREDYIQKPKLNGYRSYHMTVELPVYFSSVTYLVRAEIQLRTVAQDFWARLEHSIKYKKDYAKRPEIETELKSCAETIAATDARMMGIRKKIDEIAPNEKHFDFLTGDTPFDF